MSTMKTAPGAARRLSRRLAGGLTATAVAVSILAASVHVACRTDYKKFCPSYKVGSSQLRACMRSAGGNISTRCIDALANSGEISMKYHSRNKNK
mgnify:CR=1 FL=1